MFLYNFPSFIEGFNGVAPRVLHFWKQPLVAPYAWINLCLFTLVTLNPYCPSGVWWLWESNPTSIIWPRLPQEEILSFFTPPTLWLLFDLITFQLHLTILNLQLACCTNEWFILFIYEYNLNFILIFNNLKLMMWKLK